MIINHISKTKFEGLLHALRGKSRLLIVIQDNPDPDAIGAAVALRKLAKDLGNIQCVLGHGGTIGRGENRALVRYLHLKLQQCNEIELGKFDLIAMVDTQPGTGNNSLPPGVIPNIVIDHHPFRQTSRPVQFADVRPKYGATSTILVEYLVQADIKPETSLATALLYAIRSDTQDLGREVIQADIDAIEFLYPLANKRMLSNIQQGSVPKKYYQMLFNALGNAYVYGKCIVTHLENIDNPDMIGEIADLLLREEETMWTMCTGIHRDKLLISIRTSDESNRAERVIKNIVPSDGTGGGHLTYAGGQIPLENKQDFEVEGMRRTIEEKFLESIEVASKNSKGLVQ